MDKVEAKRRFESEWKPWTAMLEAIDPSVAREPGVCGDWTVHDVVGHVQSYARFHLAQARGALTGVAPTPREAQGDRAEWPDGVANTLEARNEAIRVAGLSLTWQQLLDESQWLRSETLRWLDGLSEDELGEQVGWVNFWEPQFQNHPNNVMGLMVRRVHDIPSAADPAPAWQFVLPNKPPDHHVTEHLGQIRAWLPSAQHKR